VATAATAPWLRHCVLCLLASFRRQLTKLSLHRLLASLNLMS